MRSFFKVILYAGGLGLFYAVSFYLCESVSDSLVITGIFGVTFLICVHALIRKFTEDDHPAAGALHLKHAGGEMIRDLSSNLLVVAAVIFVSFLIWKISYPVRARVLKDIGIMLQPKDLSEEYLSSPEGQKKMGRLCYFGIAAYRIDPRVLVDWEIKAIRGMCIASDDARLIEDMEAVLPAVEEEIEFEDDAMRIKGNIAEDEEPPQEDTVIKVDY